METSRDGCGNWLIVAFLAAAVILVIAFWPGGALDSIADARTAQAQAQAAQAYAHAEVVQAQESGHTERIQTMALYFGSQSASVLLLAGLAGVVVGGVAVAVAKGQ